MYWANFLHIYQPPTQTKEILDKVTNESYRKIMEGLLENPNAKLTLNINAVLTEMLMEYGHEDVVKNIRLLLERGQIELTGSAKFHPLLPKIPKDEVIRQIRLNDETNKKYYGEAYHPIGFFPPEMGYSPEVGEIILDLGYKWIIVDELSCPQLPLDTSKIYRNNKGLNIFFRERGPSFKILSAQLGTAQGVIREFADRIPRNEYMLTAMDGETFGHHRLGLEQLLLEIYKSPELPTIKISEVFDKFTDTITLEALPSTWALMPKDIARNIPFARWDNPENPIHRKQWELTNMALDLVKAEDESHHQLLDIALHSDQYWWASAKPWWSLEMIEKGAFELLAAIRGFEHSTEKDKQKAWDLYIEIITTGFEWQRTGIVANLSKKEDEEIKERMEQDRPYISKEEYQDMIDTLKKQMLGAAADQEYSRAEQLKKRIEELTAELNKTPHEHTSEVTVNQ
jgi:predicted glycosyl hydrolase (DUF1957 family)